MAIQDIIQTGLDGGWKVQDAARLDQDLTLEADVVVIGTGAGGGTTAEILSQVGLSVIMVEEGNLHHMKHFKMNELEAYGSLYQEAAGRTTEDQAISILQGRTVGGSTTVNWTTSLRTPSATLQYWREMHGLADYTDATMEPWFQDRYQRMNINEWIVPPNANNAALRDGCDKLGWEWTSIPRNVNSCWNLGYCGMGCPTNAKQSMLVTTVPGALNADAQLLYHARAERLLHENGRVLGLECRAFQADGLHFSGHTVLLKARHYVLSASAIGSPAVLLRSKAPDPHKTVGKRTFLHPVNATFGTMPTQVDPYYGAPQSVYSDEFLWRTGVAGDDIGFKLEVPPLHPAIAASVLGEHGEAAARAMAQLPYSQSMIALLRDGFHPDSVGGEVVLKGDGTPVLKYDISDYVWRGLRDAYAVMLELQFAAGAKKALAVHLDSRFYGSWNEAKAAVADLPMKKQRVKLFTAHQMGGCAMGDDPKTSVVNGHGDHHHLENLSVIDASCFPTSIGANPQVSIYAMAARNATRLRQRLQPA